MADKDVIELDPPMSDALRVELEYMTGSQRAAVLMLLLGEEQAADLVPRPGTRPVQSQAAPRRQAHHELAEGGPSST